MSMTLKHHYKKAHEALTNLGLTKPFRLEDMYIPDGVNLDKSTLVITPAITDDLTLYDLIKKFDDFNGQSSYIYKPLWDIYNKEIRQEARASFILQGASDNRDDSHLYYREKSIKEQRELLTENNQTALSPIEYIMLQTIVKAGGDLIDGYTWCRMAGLPDKAVGDVSYVGYVDSNVGQARFGRSRGRADWGVGVGLSVGLDIRPSASSLSSSSSFDPAAELRKLTDKAYDQGFADGRESLRKLLAILESGSEASK